MPDPTHVEQWDDLAPWLAQLDLAGARPLRRITDEHGAYSPAGRWIVERRDGTRCFVKAMRARSVGSYGLECEHAVAVHVGTPHAPEVLGWMQGDDERDVPSILVVEDLSAATWGTPLDAARVRGLRTALDHVESVVPPVGIRRLEGREPWTGRGWRPLLDRPDELVALELVDPAWLDRHGAALVAAADSVDPNGDGLVHGDLWLQNWCSRMGGATLIDWTAAAVGNPRINHAWAECGVRAGAGPVGLVLGPDVPEHDAWAAWMAGLACSFVALDEFDRAAHARLHRTQLREAIASLEWACDALDLPHPVGVDALRVAVGPWEP